MPALEINKLEATAWEKARNSEIDASQLQSELSKLRVEVVHC